MNEKLFIDKWISNIKSQGIKNFPKDFINESELNSFSIPKKTLVLGQEFFGSYEILTTRGDQVYQASTLDEAKFFIYSAKERNGLAYLPKDKLQIKSVVDLYNKELDNLVDQIKKDYKKTFPESKNLLAVTNEIFQKLNLIRY